MQGFSGDNGVTQVGDMVTGHGKKSMRTVHIVVDKICPIGSFVAGRVVMNQRLTNRRDMILAGEASEGWTPSDEKITFKKSLSRSIYEMKIGDIIEVEKQAHKVTTCRNIAARIAVDEGRVYTVNRTAEGCKITRKE